MRIVIALGGNALLHPREPLDADIQRRNAERAARSLAPIARDHDVVITHGNGPQVGLLALESGTSGVAAPYPLDVLGAESQGMVGYLLAVALRNALPGRPLATVLTEVEVDPDDPAFRNPTKPVGPVLTEQPDIASVRALGYTFAPDRGGWRRVVPSPAPARVLASGAVAALTAAGFLVVAAGGGGVPVVRRGTGYAGVEAVIDKDATSSMLALDLGADWLLLLTDVAGVYQGEVGFGAALGRATPDVLRSMGLPAGSMGPKAEAACRFVERSGGRAAIGALDDAVAILQGSAVTHVVPNTASGRSAGEEAI